MIKAVGDPLANSFMYIRYIAFFEGMDIDFYLKFDFWRFAKFSLKFKVLTLP